MDKERRNRDRGKGKFGGDGSSGARQSSHTIMKRKKGVMQMTCIRRESHLAFRQ